MKKQESFGAPAFCIQGRQTDIYSVAEATKKLREQRADSNQDPEES